MHRNSFKGNEQQMLIMIVGNFFFIQCLDSLEECA